MNKNVLFLDIEVYLNFTLIVIKHKITGEVEFYINDKTRKMDLVRLEKVLKTNVIVTFNGDNYDLPLINFILLGYSPKEIKLLSDQIIVNKIRAWELYRCNKIKPARLLSLDLMGLIPGHYGLKFLSAICNIDEIRELPISPSKLLSNKEKVIITEYCENDIEATELLFKRLEPEIKLRFDILNKTNDNRFLGRSEPQIAENLIALELIKVGCKPKKPDIKLIENEILTVTTNGQRYNLPSSKRAFKYISNHKLKFTKPNKFEPFSYVTKIGNLELVFGLGGLHSSEKSRSIVPSSEQLLIDLDVRSYYPSLILNIKENGLLPKFKAIYKKLYLERLNLVKRNQPSNLQKLMLNGCFGKLKSPFSFLFSPETFINVTLNGQLFLLMLIDRMVDNGFSVVSANTDGILCLIDKCRFEDFKKIAERFTKDTSFELELNRFKAVYSCNVNNYIAIKQSGELKRKGLFETNESKKFKPPNLDIVIDSAVHEITTGLSAADYYKTNDSITKLLRVQNVNGGAYFNGMQYVGNVVRFYHGLNSNFISRKNGNLVSNSQGAHLLLNYDDFDPSVVNHEYYLNQITALMIDCGYLYRDQLRFK